MTIIILTCDNTYDNDSNNNNDGKKKMKVPLIGEL